MIYRLIITIIIITLVVFITSVFSSIYNYPDYRKLEFEVNKESSSLYNEISNLESDMRWYKKRYGSFNKTYMRDEYQDAYIKQQKQLTLLPIYKQKYQDMMSERDHLRMFISYRKKVINSALYTGIGLSFLIFLSPIIYKVISGKGLKRSPSTSALLSGCMASIIVYFSVVFGPPLKCVTYGCVVLAIMIALSTFIFSIVVSLITLIIERKHIIPH